MSQTVRTGNLSKEDVTKILSEINQIHNQRFQLTLSAITVFGVFIAWVIPSVDKPGIQVSEFSLAAPFLLLIFLFLLFLYAHTLNRTGATLSTYLRVTKQSKWEEDFKSFKGDRIVGYAFIQSMIFLSLGLITFLFPWLVNHLSGVEFTAPPKVKYFLISFGIIYIITILSLSFFDLKYHEHKVKERWEKLRKDEKI